MNIWLQGDRLRKVLLTVVCLLLAYHFVNKGLIPAMTSIQTDFSNYYIPARIIAEGGNLADVYDNIWLQRYAHKYGINDQIVSFVPFPPTAALVMLPFATHDPLEAKRIWLGFNIIVLILCAVLLTRLLKVDIRIVFIFFIGSDLALINNFMYGQFYIVLIFLLLCSFFLEMKQNVAWAGFLLAIAISVKIIPIILFLYYFATKKGKMILSTVVWVILINGVSLCLTGWECYTVFLRDILFQSAGGMLQNPYWPTFTTIGNVLLNAFVQEPLLNPNPFVHAPALAYFLNQFFKIILVLITLMLIIKRTRRSTTNSFLKYSLVIFLGMLLTDTTATYYLILVVPSCLALFCYWRNRNNWRLSLLLLLFHFLIGSRHLVWFSDHSSGLVTWNTYLRLMILIVLLGIHFATIWQLKKDRAQPFVTSRYSNTWAALCYIVVFSLCASLTLSLIHWKRLKTDDAQLIFLRDQKKRSVFSYSFSQGRIVYSTFGIRDGILRYVLRLNEHTRIPRLRGNCLAPCLCPDTSTVVFEYIENGQHKLGTWTIGTEPNMLSPGNHLIIQPNCSHKSDFLVFVTEIGGNNDIHLGSLESIQDAIPLAASTADEREPCISPDDSTVFYSSNETQKFKIYQTVIGSGRHSQVTFGNGDDRTPALSPDGTLLLFSSTRSGNWDIWCLDRVKNEYHQLTFNRRADKSPHVLESGKFLFLSDRNRGIGFYAYTVAIFLQACSEEKKR